MRTRNGGPTRHPLAHALLALLLVAAGPVHAKEARATMTVSVMVLSACSVSTDQRDPTCSASAPPTVEHRTQGQGPGQVQLTVVTF